MTSADIEAVRCLEKEAFTTTWQEEAFANELAHNRTATYLVLRAPDGNLAGYAGFWLVLDEAHVTSIAVHPDYRGRQLGKQLMHAMVSRAAQLGALWMTLEVRADNPAAQQMYRRFGFARVGIRPKYYEGSVDAWIMWAGNLQSESYQQRLAGLSGTRTKE
ncbi:ribosomal protein S18-alanine N-acetyltransferase [bacterium]|nr:ribosomal protein S18-alanine N-acetyltransferase [bacterium]